MSNLPREKMRLYMRERRKREKFELEALRIRLAEYELLVKQGKVKDVEFCSGSVDSLVDRVMREKEARLKG